MSKLFPLHIGCAGWSIRKEFVNDFDPTGSHLQRYASRFNAVEINSTFKKSHMRKTYERWAESVPEAFRFSVKLPKEITHDRQLKECEELLKKFLGEVGGLGTKLGPILIQLPQTFVLNMKYAERFFSVFRESYLGPLVLEARNKSWFSDDVNELLQRFTVSHAVVDPAPLADAAKPIGVSALRYLRLHGSPRMYYSSYDDAYLSSLAADIMKFAQSGETWCIFDNTADGHAFFNCFFLYQQLQGTPGLVF